MLGAINPNGSQTLDAQIRNAREEHLQLAPGQPVPNEASSILTTVPTAGSSIEPLPAYGQSSALSGGDIAGIVVGGAAFIAMCVGVAFCSRRRSSVKTAMKRSEIVSSPYPVGNYSSHDPRSPSIVSPLSMSPAYPFTIASSMISQPAQ